MHFERSIRVNFFRINDVLSIANVGRDEIVENDLAKRFIRLLVQI